MTEYKHFVRPENHPPSLKKGDGYVSLNRTDMWKNVYVTPDMTRKEQEIDYNLRKELKERREKGEKNLVMRGGRLVTLEPRPKEKPPEPRKYRSRELRSSVRSNTE